MKKRVAFLAAACAALAASVVAGVAAASSPNVVVMPTDAQGWSTSDTRPGGDVGFVADETAPAGVGALRLRTDATTTAKAQYLHVPTFRSAG